MNQLKIKRSILRNYAKALIELEEKGIGMNELVVKKIIEQATKVGLSIYKREQELKRTYYKCYMCKNFFSREDNKMVRNFELIEELRMVRLQEKACGLCEVDFYE